MSPEVTEWETAFMLDGEPVKFISTKRVWTRTFGRNIPDAHETARADTAAH